MLQCQPHCRLSETIGAALALDALVQTWAVGVGWGPAVLTT